jgi:hypothetical protein
MNRIWIQALDESIDPTHPILRIVCAEAHFTPILQYNTELVSCLSYQNLLELISMVGHPCSSVPEGDIVIGKLKGSPNPSIIN